MADEPLTEEISPSDRFGEETQTGGFAFDWQSYVAAPKYYGQVVNLIASPREVTLAVCLTVPGNVEGKDTTVAITQAAVHLSFGEFARLTDLMVQQKAELEHQFIGLSEKMQQKRKEDENAQPDHD